MRLAFAATAAFTGALSFGVGSASARRPAAPVTISAEKLSEVIDQYCVDCHNPQDLRGNLSLEGFDVAKAAENTHTAERMIRKLRAQMMPPPGVNRPSPDTLRALVETLENTIDRAAKPNPGTRTFQRLNRAEYENAVRDLFGIEIDASELLPPDTKSANFDNIADVQSLSPTLLESYLNAASAVARVAVGDKNAATTQATYHVSPFASQHPWDHVDGTPYGTRGGLVTTHSFPADAQYTFRINVGGGVGTRLEDIDISIDGSRAALLHYEKGIGRNTATADFPAGFDFVRSEPLAIPAGQHKVSVTFVRRTDGPYEDLIKPHEWSRAANGTGSAGTTEPPEIFDFSITGPVNATGVSETPSRKIIFSCHPSETSAQRACAQQIIDRIGLKAYRHPLTDHDRDALLGFYDRGAKTGGFETGVSTALQAMLASPYFVFRFEAPPPNTAPGATYALNDFDLASRLSFFVWSSLPDDELLTLASQHKLSDPKTLDKEVHRMLADPRAEALSTRFAAQWLRLQDVSKVHPDAFLFPDFNQELADAMVKETELFFNDIVQNDHSVLDIFTANYTFVNERLARHYGIQNVAGNEFRKVQYPDANRRGILGQGSMLVQTSLGNRTSPVLRGKWVMEVLIGMPPPPPPPNVPDLEQTKDAKDGKPLTTRERMEIHRASPACKSCHLFIDPIGLSLDNFDVTGKWRYRENGVVLDTRGQLYDGTQITNPTELTNALLKRPVPLLRNFTTNLMAYALGRRVEDYDQPTIRAIVKDAESKGYKMSSFILGVVNSDAFREKRAEAVSN